MNVIGKVGSELELNDLVLSLSARHAEHRLFFRGQVKLHPTIRASRNRPSSQPNSLTESAWIAFASNALALSRPSNTSGQVKAILQHYGMPTYFLDLTTDVLVAGWFARNKYYSQRELYIGEVFRTFDRVNYRPIGDKVGYIIVFSVPNPLDLLSSERLFDLSSLPDSFVRPKRQKAWLLLDRPPTMPDPGEFVLGVIEVDWSFSSSLTQDQLFPQPEHDPCYSRLLSIPFVEIPMEWFSQPVKDRQSGYMRLATRALSTPEYGETLNKPFVNHKWADIWIYEPKPIRLWKEWRFDLSTIHSRLTGDIRETAKVTVSPSAYSILSTSNDFELEWPALGKEGIFFTEAQLEHDKFSDHGPPYHGFWIQKHEDLLVETPMVSDFENLSVTPGHVYFFSDGKIQRQLTANGCSCNHPETHDLRVLMALRLPAAIRSGRVLLVPHERVPEAYIAFTEADMDFMKPGIERTQEMMRRIFAGISRHRKVETTNLSDLETDHD